MTDKKRFFLLALVLLQTACMENVVNKPTVIKKPVQHPRVSSTKHPQQHEPLQKQAPIQAEETATSRDTLPVTEPQHFESKSRPTVLTPAVRTLMADAEKNTKAGDLDSASSTLERALRISPRNAVVTYQLAVLRLKQSQPRLAEDLGKKAALLAGDDRELKKRCWLLIAEAREAQGNAQGANEARLKAESLE
jgi:predicted Zn-dependent protease